MKVYIITEIDYDQNGSVKIAGAYTSGIMANLQLQRLIKENDKNGRLCDYELHEEEVI